MEIPTTPIPVSPKKFTILEILQLTVLGGIILYFGKAIFIPLSFAMLISFILYPVCKWMEKKGVNRRVAIVLAMLFIMILLGAIFYLLFSQLIEFTYEWHIFKAKIIDAHNELSLFLAERFGVSSEQQLVFIKKIIGSGQILSLIQSTAYSLSESFFFLLMILIFSSLILFYRKLLTTVVYRLFPAERKTVIHEILVGTIHSYYSFMKGMLIVYLIVGILNSIGLYALGIPHPFLFGFIASVLTFIPYVGIMIASLLPITVAWIEFNSIWYPVGVIIIFSIVQLLEAYIIFPLAVGGRLRINTLAILVMIIFGGIIWGAAGMILFIPFISIVKLIADRTDSLKTLSLLLGEGKNSNITP